MLLPDIATDYLNYLLYERGLSENTYYGYKCHLQQLQVWLIAEGEPESLPLLQVYTTARLRQYVHHLSKKGLSASTIRSKFDAIRGLGAFCVETGILSDSPAAAVHRPKKGAAKRLLVSEQEVVTILEACDRQRNPATAAISKAMLSVLVYCGLRTAELLALKTNDINLDSRTLLVAHGKGDKSRLLYPNDECLSAVERWLQYRPSDHKTDWMWTTGKEHKYAEAGLWKVLETVKAIAGFAGRDNIKPHSIRHFFATRLMENGADIKSIQSALGHAQPHTTFIYLHAAERPAKAMASFPCLTTKKNGKADEPTAPAHPVKDFDRGQVRIRQDLQNATKRRRIPLSGKGGSLDGA